eukprot:80515_1
MAQRHNRNHNRPHQVFMKLFCQNCIQSSPLSWPIRAETIFSIILAIENAHNDVQYLYLEELRRFLNIIIKPEENSNISRLINKLLTDDPDKCTINVSELTEMCKFYQMEEY